MADRNDEIPLAEAARFLGRSWERAWRLLLNGALEGRRLENGRWLVTRRSVEALKQREREGESRLVS